MMDKKPALLVYVDLSHCITDGEVSYPGDPPTVVWQWATLGKDRLRLKQISLGSHSSTHLDSPSHLVDRGKTLDSYPPFSFFHTAFVLDCRDLPCIAKEQVERVPLEVTAVLFFTGWQEYWNLEQYYEDPPLLTEAAASLLMERGVSLVGFDSSSCDALASEDLPIHHLVFSNGGLILENLCNLDKVVGKTVSLVALPMLLEESDGAPTRVIVSYTL